MPFLPCVIESSTSVLDLARMIDDNVEFLPERDGEVRVSRADTSDLKEILNFLPSNRIKQWIKDQDEPETIKQKDR